MMKGKYQHYKGKYYEVIGLARHSETLEEIRNYDEVILFGPTNAKVELLNILKKDHLFEKIKIDVLPADKMTENQLHAFVKEHFSKH